MFDFSKLSLGYENIILSHGKGVVKSRSECDISCKIGGVRLATPVLVSNMPYLQEPNPEFLEIFNKRKWGYIYHRLGGNENILNFVRKINNENWHFKSISIGIKEEDLRLLEVIKQEKLKLDCLTIDVAFVYTQYALEFVERVRRLLPYVYLVAGNFDTPWAALELEKIGVDCGKMAIGVSSNCATVFRTGFGTRIISDLVKCKEMTSRIKFLTDGGLTIHNDEASIGDAFKSLVFGGNYVLSASLFQRVTELADDHGNILCYGNSTARAKKHDNHDEGYEFQIKTNGKSLEKQMNLIEQSLKSSCSYAGIDKITNAYKSCDYKIVF